MNGGGFGAWFAFVVAGLLSGAFVLLAAFAQALDGLSDVRRKAMIEENPGRWDVLLGDHVERASRVAVRLTAQGTVLAGLLSLGSGLAACGVAEPFLVGAVVVLLGWLAMEALVLRWTSRRGAESLLDSLFWLVPLVVLASAPLRPLLSRLLAPGTVRALPEVPETAAEKEAGRDAEVRALLDVAREEGILDQHEEELVSRAVDFGERSVAEVMTPRPDMVFAEVSSPLGEVADLFVRTKLTRIPLVDGSFDRPAGIVHVKDVFAALRSAGPPATARALAREVLFAPESQSVPTLLADFRRKRQHLAVVVDEYGSVTGLVTLEDLVEELVGEIADEHEDEEDPVLALPGGGYSVAGRVRTSEVASLFGTAIPPSGYDTVAGLLSETLGRIPHAGDEARVGGLTFAVEEADRRRVHRVRVTREEAATAPTIQPGPKSGAESGADAEAETEGRT